MKQKFATILLGMISSSFALSAQSDPVIMTINNDPISKSEFEYIYNKNNSHNTLDKKSLDEYVDMFVNFKLKVAEAKSMGIHNTKAYQEELGTYQSQLAAPYMTDKETEEKIMKEAYERMKEDVEVSHILIKSSRTDTTEAYKKAYNLYEKLRKGANFETLAKESSECPSSEKGGHLGYITAFSTVYPFETAAYNTLVGTYSKPALSSFGYHIVKVHNRRPNRGSVHVAHIFSRIEKQDQTTQAKEKADSLYLLLQNGADFAEIAKKFSNDLQSAARGGDIGWVEGGRLPIEFEDAAFALKNKGDMSPVVKTAYGYHILKLLDKKGLDSYKNMHESLKNKVFRDERATQLNDAFVEKLKQKHGFRLMNGALDPFYQIMNTEDAEKVRSLYLRMEAPLYSLNGNVYPQKEFVEYFDAEKAKMEKAKQNKNTQRMSSGIDTDLSGKEFVDKTFARYIKDIVVKEEEQALGKEYPEYRNLLREYSDGLLLFEISNKEVWNKASTDQEGLEQFFKENKDNYKWEKPRFRGKVLYCVDKKTLAEAEKLIKKIPEDSIDVRLKREFNKEKVRIRIENGLYAQGTNKAIDTYIFKTGTYTDEKFPAVKCIGKTVSAPETYKDVRGPITADYQNFLEEKWINMLRNKHKVVINQEVLKTVKSN